VAVNVKITNLPPAVTPTGTEVLALVQSGVTVKNAVNTLLSAPGGAGWVGNTPAGTVAATTVQAAINELDTEKASLAALAASSGSSLVGFLQAGSGAVVRTAQSKMRDVVSVKDFGAVGDGVVDDTVAIQNALNAANYVFLPPGTYLFSTLTVRQNTRLQGASTRTSILKHTGAGAAITCTHSGATEPDGTAAYIESGWFIFEDFELQANGTFGFRVGNTRSSFAQWNRIYMRHLNDGGTYAAGTVAIDCDNTPWSSSESTYLSKIHHTFIRGFETAVNLQDVVNAWEINRLYTISCLKQVVLSNATGIGIIDSYFESGIAGAIGITFLAGGGNQINVIGATFELTNVAATQYAYSFAGGTWETIMVMGAKYLIQGDGNAVNSRRITGTAPLSFVELGRTYTNLTLSQNLPMLWAPGVANNKPFQAPNFLRLGGVPGGDGRVILARGGNDASDGWIENDGAFGLDFVSPGSGSVVDFDWRGSDGTLHLRFQAYSGGSGKGLYTNLDNQLPLGGASNRWSEIYASDFRPGAGTAIWTSGAGTPEGAVTAPVGSLFTRTDGGAGTTLYVKESGAGNTGWVAK